MRKSKVSGEVALMEVPGGALLGVRTRSRTLALQRAQRPPDKGEAGEAAGEYLELRSRRLEKPPKEQAAAPAPKSGAATKAAAAAASPALAEDEVEVSDELKRDDSGSCGRDAVSHRIDAFLWMETPFFPTSKGI